VTWAESYPSAAKCGRAIIEVKKPDGPSMVLESASCTERDRGQKRKKNIPWKGGAQKRSSSRYLKTKKRGGKYRGVYRSEGDILPEEGLCPPSVAVSCARAEQMESQKNGTTGGGCLLPCWMRDCKSARGRKSYGTNQGKKTD